MEGLEYSEFCQFVQLMIATPPNTWDLEILLRLEMIRTKCRSQLKIDNLKVSPPIWKQSGIFRRKQLALDCFFNFTSFLTFCCLSYSNIHWLHYIFMKWIDKSCKSLSGRSLCYIMPDWWCKSVPRLSCYCCLYYHFFIWTLLSPHLDYYFCIFISLKFLYSSDIKCNLCLKSEFIQATWLFFQKVGKNFFPISYETNKERFLLCFTYYNM